APGRAAPGTQAGGRRRRRRRPRPSGGGGLPRPRGQPLVRPGERLDPPARGAAPGAGLSVRGLTAGYGDIRVLDGLDLDARAGRLTAIVGPNGAGKTTLLKALSGLIPRGGDVRLDGAALPAEASAVV